ncbi:MAG: PAS domain S-box protein [Desulfobacteraceae bacterium]|nr:PAS domain S-box protein [Desulfobacteraceae bacterium]
MPTFKIKSRILIPLVLTILFLLSVFVYGVYRVHDRNIQQQANQTFDSVESLLDSTINTNACLMDAVLGTLKRNPLFPEALRNKDRQALLTLSRSLYEELHSDHDITHLYFSDPGRVNLLRVHKPDRYGDIINRFTTVNAEKTGKTFQGIEMGPLGTFTLRVVAPWYEENRLIGFVEIGKEIDKIVKSLTKSLKVDFFILIDKKNLNREDWENGMHMLHRMPEWNKIESFVIADKTLDEFPGELISLLNKGTEPGALKNIGLSLNDRNYLLKFLPLEDAGHGVIGKLVVMSDVSQPIANRDKIISMIAYLSVLTGGALFLFFLFFIGRMENQLSMTNQRIIELERDHSKLIMDSLPVHVSVVDENGLFTQWNPHSEKMFGYKKEEAIGKLGLTSLFKDQEEGARIEADAKQDGFLEQEAEAKTKNGQSFWMMFRMLRIVETDETSFFLTFAEDITRRKLSEIELRESEGIFRSFSSSAQEAIIRIDDKGVICFWNESAQKIFGYTAEEAAGKNLHQLLAPPRFHEAQTQPFKHFQETGMGPVVGKTLEFQGLKKDGTEFPIELSVSGIKIRDKWHATGIIRDITKRKEEENERNKMEEQLRQSQKMEAIGTLAGGIAHDFNNILSAVNGFTELALDEVEKGCTMESYLQEIYMAGKRAKDLVRQILTIARKTEEQIKPLQVDIIAKEALKLLRSSLPTTIEIKQKFKSSSLIMADPTRIHQVFMNLCTNAAHAMEEKGGVLTVGLGDIKFHTAGDTPHGKLKPGEYMEISVADTGSGISSDIIESIFNPYFTTKKTGEGTGLGLAVVNGIIKNCGGEITVNSQVGSGTVFTVYLPIIKKRAEKEPYQVEDLPAGTERILVVDDELPLLELNRKMLEGLGYAVTIQSGSLASLELFQLKPYSFDLILTDMTMPNLTGDELAREMLKIRPDIPIILFTGYSKKFTGELASEIGIKAFAYKPIDKAQMAKIVRKVLDEAKVPS